MADTLYSLTAEFQSLRDAAEFVDHATGEVIEGPALDSLLQALKGDIAQKAGGCLMVAAEFRHRAAAFKAEEERLAKRRRILEGAERRLRDYVRDRMDAAGLKRLEASTFTVTRVEGRESVTVEDPEKIPEAFKLWEWKPDVAGAKEMLREAGSLPAGFKVEQGKPYITIR